MNHKPREHRRVYLTFYLRVYSGGNLMGYLVDISSNGMKIMSEKPFSEGGKFNLKMRLPSTMELDGDRDIRFRAQCVWSRNEEPPGDLYLNGFSFADLPADDSIIIRKIIDEYRLR